jgi:diguanylate cyclase (GGDEF)-like protein
MWAWSQVRHPPGGAATGSRYRLTAWRSRFAEVERERRLYAQQLPLQRRSTQAAAVMVALSALAQFPLAAATGGRPITDAGALALIVSAAASLLLAIAMSTDRSPRRTLGLITVAAFVIPGVCGTIIAAGADIGAQTILLVAGGVIMAYFSSRLDLLGTILTALAYSTITLSSWLLFGPPVRRADVVYSLFAVAMLHVLGIAETRRLHREIRSTFAQREDFHRLSVIDVLTGLPNRRAFDDRLDAVWRDSPETGHVPAVIMVDIDHFKMLNDTLGHHAGDIALRMVADAIRGCRRAGDDHQMARYGGEEFVVLLSDGGHRAAHAVADRVVAAVRSADIAASVSRLTTPPSSYERHVTISVGIASASAAMARAQDLVDAADRQLYRAKNAGRDCVRCGEDDDVASPVYV